MCLNYLVFGTEHRSAGSGAAGGGGGAGGSSAETLRQPLVTEARGGES